ncbi:MAG: M28 family peptidase [bacterium]|nr:M28 family peptidase [bacterium]
MTTDESLSGESLLKHVKVLADDIGARPAGHPQEEQARHYVRGKLQSYGIDDVETISFDTIDSWGYGLIGSVGASLVGNIIGNRLIGGGLALLGLREHVATLTAQNSILAPLFPQRQGGTVIAKIAPKGEIKHKIVLMGHVDSNKHRKSFSKAGKKLLLPSSTLMTAGLSLNLWGLLTGKQSFRRWAGGILGFALWRLIEDEREDYVDGANDNASAVACVLGLGEYFAKNPLENTEIWLAFTGSEEVGLYGLRALLDKYEETLRDAWWIDFEMVGAGDIGFVTRHSGLNYLTPYHPHEEMVALAQKVADEHPEWRIKGTPMTILEEVLPLRQKGMRAMCVVGVGEDGWLVNWHQHSDNSDNIHPEALEKAAKFALAMSREIDKG